MFPPIINAAHLLADAGWEVTILAAPSADSALKVPPHPAIAVRQIPERPSFVVRKGDYLRYALAAARLAVSLRPDLVYASDALSAWPAVIAARLAKSVLLYHEHDSPPDTIRPWLARWRAIAARQAQLVVFPNEARANLAQERTGFSKSHLHVVWNLPRRAELPVISPQPGPLRVYFHGSITPDRMPRSLVEAVLGFGGAVQLQIAGYEAALAKGYLAALLNLADCPSARGVVSYIGQISRGNLLDVAASNHVGLAFMPLSVAEVNMHHMTGASNKAFDYMAAGLALLVSDRPDWTRMFVDPAFAKACDAWNAGSASSALNWFLEHPEARMEMSVRNRRKIELDWNYDAAFSPVLKHIHELLSEPMRLGRV